MRSAVCLVFFFQAEDGIRDLVRSRGLGDVYKRQFVFRPALSPTETAGLQQNGLSVVTKVSPTNAPEQLSLIHI